MLAIMVGAAHKRYLDAMGIQTWETKTAVRTRSADGVMVAAPPASPRPVGQSLPDWSALRQRVSGCVDCELHSTRTQTVFGVGAEDAELMFVGEAPGAEEDRRGEPFVGRAGKLLGAMLAAIEMRREQVYIANVLKCRPPNNRDPMGHEVRQCEPYLHRQVALIKPRLIVALGRFAAQSLLKTTRPIGKLRDETFRYQGTDIPLIVTYHPAYLLRNPIDKRKAWVDLCRARTLLGAASMHNERLKRR